MQQLSNQDAQAAHVSVRPRNRKTSARRKITVRLSEGVCGRLDVATDQPGVGKSMFVEAALERFLSPQPSVENLVEERFDQLHARFDRLEHDMRMMAEMVAIHARYQLAVTPPVPQERQREAILLGDERFKVLAEQVERRVRQRRPLMQETIERLTDKDPGKPAQATRAQAPDRPDAREHGSYIASENIPMTQPSRRDAEEAGTHLQARSDYSAGRRGAARKASNDRISYQTNHSTKPAPSTWRLMFAVFLPFAAGYFLSFLFRTINTAISPVLASEFGLSASEIGLLASAYFLVFAGAQIPIGVLLDRYGPRRVQGILLVVAVGGASLFGNADSFIELVIGRAMIGLGVAASLMAGLKAIVTWFPKERIALVNGGMIMLGSLGAVTATAPTDWLMNWIGWRDVFGLLTIATVVIAGMIYFIVPERGENPKNSPTSGKPLTFWSIFADRRFLRIAPLSATCIGSSWAMQSLWAGSWLADVEGLNHQGVVDRLFIMAMGMSLGALLLGTLADRLRKRGISAEILLTVFAGLFMLAELSLILRLPIPSILPWSVVSVVGAGTVLSYAIVASYFPVEIAARANGALNLMHFGLAFAVQYGTGLMVGRWLPEQGHYPAVAYQIAFGVIVALQLVALIWFVTPWLRMLTKEFDQLVDKGSNWEGHSGASGLSPGIPIREACEGAEW